MQLSAFAQAAAEGPEAVASCAAASVRQIRSLQSTFATAAAQVRISYLAFGWWW